jgi:hypothetical protein
VEFDVLGRMFDLQCRAAGLALRLAWTVFLLLCIILLYFSNG